MTNSRRLGLQKILTDIVDPYSGRAYFQPAANFRMVYPAIVYSIDSDNSRFASNFRYTQFDRYTATLITQDPDDPIRQKLLELPMTSQETEFVTEDLYHYQFTIFY